MANDRAQPPIRGAAKPVGLVLTGDFQLVIAGRVLAVPHSVERVLAFLALTDHAVSRTKLAGALWLDTSERQAANNLRTALWRLRQASSGLIALHPDRVKLSPVVRVDVAELSELSRRLIRGPYGGDLQRLPTLVECGELLPDWDDSWVVPDRERFRLLRLEALDCAASALIGRRQFGDALIAALAAVHAEPLRESARRLVVQVHTCEGNIAEAIQTYKVYRSLLQSELGVEPSRLMRQLVEPFAAGRT
jgi:DNA-binding SARP family transcriptional activator